MSNMAHDGTSCWDNLPSVIILEIFSYLEHKDRISASGVCKNWRHAFFHPRFWKDITFVYDDQESLFRARYLADCFGLSVQNATVRFETPHMLPQLEGLLRHLRENRNLRKLFIEPTSMTLDWQIGVWTELIYQSILKIIETSKQLEALTLGCFEELSVRSAEILGNLAIHRGKQLTHLGLASVKEEPENYECVSLDNTLFRQFDSLTVLTVDYDYVSDTMLESLTSGTLERLVIHLHNWRNDHPGTTNAAWQRFTHCNKRCGLRLNMLHAYRGVTVLHSEILRPAMPLTHLKALFCESVNYEALLRLSSWYDCSLKSIMWIDSLDQNEREPPTDNNSADDTADALVLIAWRCLNLVELVYIGHKYYQENLLAIARLRGHILERFEFAESNIISAYGHEFKETEREINKILGGKWKALSDGQLELVLRDPTADDSRVVIMPLVLNDAK